MAKVFNITANCNADKHYMVNLDSRLVRIKEMIDKGEYFTIHRGRQYGKTTILRALKQYLQGKYYVVFVDFQKISTAKFESENAFCIAFSKLFLKSMKSNHLFVDRNMRESIMQLEEQIRKNTSDMEISELFEYLNEICAVSDKPIVLLIDEVDRAANNQIFLDCLAMLRASYIERDSFATFQSVILAGVHDVENLRRKASCEDTHRINSPWNIAADFDIDMNFSVNEISTMLKEYELDYHTGMNIREMAELIYEYTSGYPMLVSKLCKLMDEEICRRKNYERKSQAWTREGFQEAIKITLSEKNMLFESLGEKLIRYPELKDMLRTLLFTESKIAYNVYESSMNIATMFGFVKNNHGVLAISNRIFATWLYNLYLSENKLQAEGIYKKSGK